jgi:hypothetical protein
MAFNRKIITSLLQVKILLADGTTVQINQLKCSLLTFTAFTETVAVLLITLG